VIKAASKHANVLQYFEPYAAGSGTSGTDDTDGEGPPMILFHAAQSCSPYLLQSCRPTGALLF
jgi:hypothetical protein